ncbi:hypothetical protein ACJRO7_033897 [Eucalyptus globulus]|uniref:At3g05675-like ankyrin-like domain-containing protein n=1 Tax=Eucalyptus globulus TaxID=34317 RepID=A0ABD3J4R6_EUCGL
MTRPPAQPDAAAAAATRRKPAPAAVPGRRPRGHRRTSWCCSFTVPPSSPETLVAASQSQGQPKAPGGKGGKPPEKPRESFSKQHGAVGSIPSSPQSSRSGLGLVGRIDPRRILSPGRVSPIDSDSVHDADPPPHSPAEVAGQPRSGECSFRAQSERFSMTELQAESFRAPSEGLQAAHEGLSSSRSGSSENADHVFDVRLTLRARNGGCLVLELNSEVLSANSEVFAGLIAEHQKSVGQNGSSASICRIEAPEVENLGIFRETIELMFEDDITKRLLKIGVYRCIDILEVSAGIVFKRGISSCLKYLEAVPWTEEEEEKLRSLFTRFNFDNVTTKDILSRLYMLDSENSQQNLAKQLVFSITKCTDANARNELKSLVKGLLCKSSVYLKDHADLNKEDLYGVCEACLDSLVSLLEEASGFAATHKTPSKDETSRPLIERISRQVDNINWLLEILLDRQMAEEFVEIWTDQGSLLKMHEIASPMVRYELSRVSANLFIAMGTRRLHCHSEVRAGLFQAWFGPMLLDFGWLQRCRKGLEIKLLEEAMGQTLLTIPLKQQYALFMEWFRCFSKHGSECPNLSKAFQIWWRRSFLRGSETNAIESR